MNIYLDHAATTPVHPNVREAMWPFLDEQFGNPSSIHAFGRRVRTALDEARDLVAAGLNCDSRHLIFTSGGTEADNAALIGAALANQNKGKHIVTTSIEHQAVLEACEFLQSIGFAVTFVPVDHTGRVSVQKMTNALTEETILISVMWANNEVGTIQPIAEIGAVARERGILFHTDAVQAFGMLPMDLRHVPVDLLSISAHKINGPKGVGALYMRPDIHVRPRLYGGSQERKQRPGTENAPGIVGFGKAAAIASEHMAQQREMYLTLRQAMIDVWETSGISFVINGHPTAYAPHILNVSFPTADTEMLLMNLDLAGVACASGSACTAGSLQRSHVLEAMNLPSQVADSAIRFSFGYGNTVADVRQAAQAVVDIVQR